MNKTKARLLAWMAAAMLACTGCSSGEKPANTGGAESGNKQSSDINRRRGQDPNSRPSMAGGGALPGKRADAGEARDRGESTRSDNRSEDSRGNDRSASNRDRGNANSGDNSSARSEGNRTAKRKAKSAPKMKLVAAFPNASGEVGLEAGNLVPEITGEDLEGTEFKLSDYKGKVIMLDFWGDW